MSNYNNNNGGGGSSGTVAMMTLCLSCACAVCACLSAAVVLLYNTNDAFHDWVRKTLRLRDDGPPSSEELSSAADTWVCPDVPEGVRGYTRADDPGKLGGFWCQHDGYGTDGDVLGEFVKFYANTLYASKLPPDAKKGEVFDPWTLQSRGGTWGPLLMKETGKFASWGWDLNSTTSDARKYKFTAP